MEGYKKIESILMLKEWKAKGMRLLFMMLLLNAAGFVIEPSVLYEIGMLASLVSMTYLQFDYKGY